MRKRKKWGWKAWVLLSLALFTTGITLYTAVETALGELPQYLNTRLSAALGRPVTVGKINLWPLGAFSAHDIRVLPLPNEKQPPLTAGRVRVYVAWWDLIFHRRLLVRALHADNVALNTTIDLRKPSKPQGSLAEGLRKLNQFGLREVGIHKASADITTLLATGERQPVTVRGLDVVTGLKPESFTYRVRAANWSGGGLTAHDLLLAGSSDDNTITITESRARFEGGALAAKGTYVTDGGDVAMQVQVKDLPISNVAPQMGIAPKWNVRGTVTGMVDVSAQTGQLRRIHGTVKIARGSFTRFPEVDAAANIDWKPDAVSLQNIDVQGKGVRIQGSGFVDGKASTPFTNRPYRVRGTVEAAGTEAVASLAQVLAFSEPMAGRWGIDHATASFQAKGIVGDLSRSHATGHFKAQGLMLRPIPDGKPLIVQTIEGDLVRRPDLLDLRNIRATAEGLTTRGHLTIVPGTPKLTGTFKTAGQVDLVNLNTLRSQLPEAAFWKWINPATPASRGRITFSAQGPLADPQKATGTGGFRFQEFSANAPTAAGATWTFPVREVTGRLRMDEDRLAISDIDLRSDLFTAAAQGVVRNLSTGGIVSGTMRLVSSQWPKLPPLQGRIPAGLSGGTLVVVAHAKETPPGAAPTPVTGTLDLDGATYRATFQGRERILPIRSATATYQATATRVIVPSYEVVTPQFRTTGQGTGRREGEAPESPWLARGQGVLVTGDAGDLLRWGSGSTFVEGGDMTARYTFDAPLAAPEKLAINARVRVVDARPILPAGTLPFNTAEAHIRSLTGTFSMQNGAVRFSDALWEAPRFRAVGSGEIAGNVLDGSFRLATRHWQRIAGELARSLPVSGGTLVLTGQVRGPVDRLREVPVRGTLTLQNARLASDRNASVPIEGGDLDLKANVQGTLNDLVGANVDGSFDLRNLSLPALRPGAARLGALSASGRFHRSGTRVSLTDLAAEAPGVRMTGQGELRGVGTGSASHAFTLNAQGPALAKVLPALAPLPGKASGGRFSGSLTVSGTAVAKVAQMEGRAEVYDAQWTPPGQTIPMPIQKMAAHFTRRGSEATLDNVELRVAGGEATLAGTLQGLGTPNKVRHNLRLAWKLEDASAWATRFLPIPGWFSGGVFTGEAKVVGTASDPAQDASGKFEVRDAGFMPPGRFLGGPVKPVHVQWARGVFRRDNGKTALNDLDLNTSVGTATGRVVSDDRSIADITMKAMISRLEPLVDLWPGFQDRLRGGRGEMTLALHGPLRRPQDLKGPVDIIAREAVLTVEAVDELYAEHPIDRFTARLVLAGGGAVRIEQARMRGPKSNVDAQGTITAGGKVTLKGKGWFTKAFTKKVVKPRFLYPLARFIGYGRMHSDFKVDGTLRQAKLKMAITNSLLWKIGMKRKVPENLRKIATGKAPLWSVDTFEGSRIAGR
jgi:hypothetical protein